MPISDFEAEIENALDFENVTDPGGSQTSPPKMTESVNEPQVAKKGFFANSLITSFMFNTPEAEKAVPEITFDSQRQKFDKFMNEFKFKDEEEFTEDEEEFIEDTRISKLRSSLDNKVYTGDFPEEWYSALLSHGWKITGNVAEKILGEYFRRDSILPDWIGGLHIIDDISLTGWGIECLPTTFRFMIVNGTLDLSQNNLIALPSLRNMKVNVMIVSHNILQCIPSDICDIEATALFFNNNKITDLPVIPRELVLNGDLDLSGNNIATIPDSYIEFLFIGGVLNLNNTLIEGIPEGLEDRAIGGIRWKNATNSSYYSTLMELDFGEDSLP